MKPRPAAPEIHRRRCLASAPELHRRPWRRARAGEGAPRAPPPEMPRAGPAPPLHRTPLASSQPTRARAGERGGVRRRLAEGVPPAPLPPLDARALLLGWLATRAQVLAVPVRETRGGRRGGHSGGRGAAEETRGTREKREWRGWCGREGWG
jgi:hypothetical protein